MAFEDHTAQGPEKRAPQPVIPETTTRTHEGKARAQSREQETAELGLTTRVWLSGKVKPALMLASPLPHTGRTRRPSHQCAERPLDPLQGRGYPRRCPQHQQMQWGRHSVCRKPTRKMKEKGQARPPPPRAPQSPARGGGGGGVRSPRTPAARPGAAPPAGRRQGCLRSVWAHWGLVTQNPPPRHPCQLLPGRLARPLTCRCAQNGRGTQPRPRLRWPPPGVPRHPESCWEPPTAFAQSTCAPRLDLQAGGSGHFGLGPCTVFKTRSWMGHLGGAVELGPLSQGISNLLQEAFPEALPWPSPPSGACSMAPVPTPPGHPSLSCNCLELCDAPRLWTP